MPNTDYVISPIKAYILTVAISVFLKLKFWQGHISVLAVKTTNFNVMYRVPASQLTIIRISKNGINCTVAVNVQMITIRRPTKVRTVRPLRLYRTFVIDMSALFLIHANVVN